MPPSAPSGVPLTAFRFLYLQVLLSQAAYEKIKDTELGKERNRLSCVGRFEMPDATDKRGTKVWELRSRGLEARYFGGIARKGDGISDEREDTNTSRSVAIIAGRHTLLSACCR